MFVLVELVSNKPHIEKKNIEFICHKTSQNYGWKIPYWRQKKWFWKIEWLNKIPFLSFPMKFPPLYEKIIINQCISMNYKYVLIRTNWRIRTYLCFTMARNDIKFRFRIALAKNVKDITKSRLLKFSWWQDSFGINRTILIIWSKANG